MENATDCSAVCVPSLYYASSPEAPLLMGKGSIVSFYTHQLVSQMMSHCIPCACCCPHYKQRVSNRFAHKLLPIEEVLKLLYLPQSDNIIASYNAFKLDHDRIIDSYRSDAMCSSYKCCLCSPLSIFPCFCLSCCLTREDSRVFHSMTSKMLQAVEQHRESLSEAGLSIKTAHIAAPFPDQAGRFPYCFKRQKEVYSIPYSTAAIVLYKDHTTPPKDIDELLAMKYPHYSHFMWR